MERSAGHARCGPSTSPGHRGWDERCSCTRFQLYLSTTVANLTLVAAKAGRPANTGGGSSAGSALRAGTIRSALEIVPARLGQILTPALLASASLPEYTSPNKGFRPDF